MPCIEDEVLILSQFLFDGDSIKDKNEDLYNLYKLWRSREKAMKGPVIPSSLAYTNPEPNEEGLT